MLSQLLLAATLAAALPAPEAEGPNSRIEGATVVQVSPRPQAGSGVFAIYADFEVATRSGERLRMYVLWMGGSQYLPDVGAVCTINYRHEQLARGNLHNPPARVGRPEGPVNVVSELSCAPGLPLHAPREHSTSALFAVPPGMEQLSGPDTPGFLSWARVARVSPRPRVLSSLIMITTDFDVQTLDGRQHMMRMLYQGPDQFIPPVGSVCWIRFHTGRLFLGTGIDPPNEVEQVGCNTGRSTTDLADGRVRIEGIRISSSPPMDSPRWTVDRRNHVIVWVDAPGRDIDSVLLPPQLARTDRPAAGATCSFTFHYDSFSAHDPRNPRQRGSSLELVVDEMECTPAPAGA